ncbi:hypothetical protein, partial [Salmonella enterica]|uniref:hypothetical protein n=1 Tax=Salmonella enterica TaxID=28901 RepID=UPI0022455E31
MSGVVKGTVYVKTKAELVDVLSAAAAVPEVKKDSEFPWIKLNIERYILPMMDSKMVEMTRDPMGSWIIAHDGVRLSKDTTKA